MIIGIDGNEANIEKRVGIGRYAFEILRRFAEKAETSKKFKFIVYLKSKPLFHMPIISENWKYRILKPGKLWTQWRLPLDLFTSGDMPDVFFTPSHYAPRISPVPTVVSVMDLSYIYFPELFEKNDLYQLQNWTSYSVRRAKKVITISNSSKNDIIKEYKLNPDKIVVTYLSTSRDMGKANLTNQQMNNILKKYNVSTNFILFVGTLQPRKNIVRLIEAFSIVLKNSQIDAKKVEKLHLVIIGKKGWLYDEILSAPKEYDVENKVKFLENVDDTDLEVFYKSARCFILPSLYEGFGLPVLEAMQGECPVITSNVSSLPEAGGDAVLYVDPEDPADIAQKIETLITDEKLRKELIAKGRRQIKKFSWDRAALETLKVLEEVGGRNV